MAHNGNAAKWHFLPYITCGQVIPILKLEALEDRIIMIKKFPNSLNRMAHPRATCTRVHDGTRALHVHATNGDNRVEGRAIDGSVQITVFACGADGSEQQ